MNMPQGIIIAHMHTTNIYLRPRKAKEAHISINRMKDAQATVSNRGSKSLTHVTVIIMTITNIIISIINTTTINISINTNIIISIINTTTINISINTNKTMKITSKNNLLVIIMLTLNILTLMMAPALTPIPFINQANTSVISNLHAVLHLSFV
jgi:hypothetical protein